jgi:tocopherol O-methyltransferase
VLTAVAGRKRALSVQAIQKHYDLASPYYLALWGRHLHHGLFETGNESKEEAAEQLLRLIVEKAAVLEGANVLDVGCGMGGTSIWLAEQKRCHVVGITLSPVQARMATEGSIDVTPKPIFIVADADHPCINGHFDFVFAVEMISHLSDRNAFFRYCAERLITGGRMCIAAWMKANDLSYVDEARYITPIEQGMLVSLPTIDDYYEYVSAANMRLLHYGDISSKVSRTWDICTELVQNKALWQLAGTRSREFVSFLRSFGAMRNGFRSGAFRYAVMVLEK